VYLHPKPLPQVANHHGGSNNLQHEMSATLQPAHFLVLDHPFCGQGIDREFCQARRNLSA
jgi:hypothetical protein